MSKSPRMPAPPACNIPEVNLPRVLVEYRVHPESATRDTQSGWGTTAHTKAGKIPDARVSIFERGPFDPRAFESLGRYQNVTERLE